MKKTLSLILIIFIFSCASLKQNGNELLLNNKNVEIVKILSINNSDTIYMNELRLHLSSVFYTYRYMYKRFGKWNKVVKINNNERYLIWENCNLFEENNEFYTVAASGIESRKEMYSSVIIWNKNKKDLLSEQSKLKDTLVSMFHYGTKKITFSKDMFYKEYWKMREEIKK